MANTVLQSMGRFNQFLGQEVTRKKIEDRETLVNETGSQIAKRFSSLSDDASVEDVSKLVMESMAYAGGRGVLKESLPIMNILSQQAAQQGKYRDLVEVASVVNQTIPSAYQNELAGIDKPLVRMQAFEALDKRAWEEKVVEDGQTILRKYNIDKDSGKQEVVRETSLGASPGATAAAKARIDMEKTTHEYKLKAELERVKQGLSGSSSGIKGLNILSKQRDLLSDKFEDVSNTIINMTNLSTEEKKEIKKSYPGGVSKWVEDLVRDPEEVQKRFVDVPFSKMEGIEGYEGHPLVGLAAPGFKGAVSQSGAVITDGFLAPQGAKFKFMDWIQTRESIQGVDKQIEMSAIDPTKAAMDRLERQNVISRVEMSKKDIGTIISNKNKYPNGFKTLSPRIRKLANDNLNTIEYVWEHLTEDERNSLSMELLIEMQANKNIKR